MKKLLILALPVVLMGCSELSQVAKGIEKEARSYTQNGGALSDLDISNGLKEALKVGTGNTVSRLTKAGGYFNNANLRIPFPAEFTKVADRMRDMGFSKLVNDFEKSMNTGAEKAAAKAKPIFVSAITAMTLNDARKILMDGNGAATDYFKRVSQQKLYQAYYPSIKTALNQVNATKYWTDITSRYNKIPFVEKVNTDLTDYVTNKALTGLFSEVEKEENKIRTNPSARVNDLLRKVFK
ncbi:MAG: hypothetical protein ACJAY8_001006 [Sphingobacteriales bacterium]|jgi:hypothetical protein